MNKKTLITGANGFLGAYLYKELSEFLSTVGVYRSASQVKTVSDLVVPDFVNYQNWEAHLHDIDCIIHCAARAHVMKDIVTDPLTEFRKVNTQGTLNLAHQAVISGVRRFIFISTVKVNGEETKNSNFFKASDRCQPTDPYAVSKYEAEQKLLEIASKSDMEVVIIRPPLIYGPKVKGNLKNLISLIKKPVILPFKSIQNYRSMVSIYNLVDFIKLCITKPEAKNEIFMVSDGNDISTGDLISELIVNYPSKASCINCPPVIISNILNLIGKKNITDRLFNSLRVDIAKNNSLLNWAPKFTISESFKMMAAEDETNI